MTLHEGTIKSPRKRPHLRVVIDSLRALGATDVVVKQKRHMHLKYRLNGARMVLSLPLAPRNQDDASRRALRRIRQQVFEASSQPTV